MKLFSNLHGKIIATIVMVVLIVVLMVSIFSNNFITLWNLFPQSEPLTELYFTHYSALPTNIVKNQPIIFSFTIHNLENKDMIYTYEVYVTSDNGKKLVNSQQIPVKKNDYFTKSISIVLSNTLSRTAVYVNLLHKNESLHFWLQGNLSNETI